VREFARTLMYQVATVQGMVAGPMTFDEILTQVCELLKRQGRVSYRALSSAL